jgi:hypothetical protein
MTLYSQEWISGLYGPCWAKNKFKTGRNLEAGIAVYRAWPVETRTQGRTSRRHRQEQARGAGGYEAGRLPCPMSCRSFLATAPCACSSIHGFAPLRAHATLCSVLACSQVSAHRGDGGGRRLHFLLQRAQSQFDSRSSP